VVVAGGADVSVRVEFIVAASRMAAAREPDDLVAVRLKSPFALAMHWIWALSGLTDVGRWTGLIGLTGFASSLTAFCQ
jgi:hypothetical protein